MDRLCHFGRREIDKPRGKLTLGLRPLGLGLRIENNPIIGDH